MSTETVAADLNDIQRAALRAEKAAIFSEAIRATGGPTAETNASVKIYIDKAHPDFVWGRDWSAEIDGARAALGKSPAVRRGSPPAEKPKVAASKGEPAQIGDFDVAKQFLQATGNLSLDAAFDVLGMIEAYGGVAKMRVALESWAELLDAADGDTQVIDRVLAVLDRRLRPAAFPRLAEESQSADAA